MPNGILNRYTVNPVNIDLPRSEFKMNHSHKFSANLGECIPTACFEILPGDTFSINTSKVVRMQPLVCPIMDNLYLDQYWFFVPQRLIHAHMPQFFGENDTAPWAQTTTYYLPQIQVPSGGYDVGTIADHLGVPPKQGAGRTINALPFRAYASIMDSWFRDENLENPVQVSTGDTTVTGVNTGDQVTDIQKGGLPFIACKFQDLFTTALPSPQKSANPVTFSLAGDAPVSIRNKMAVNYNDVYVPYVSGQTPLGSVYGMFQSDGTNWLYKGMGSGKHNAVISNNELNTDNTSTTSGGYSGIAPMNLFADMSSVTQFNVNELRSAFALQRFLEKSARGGTRYIELVQAMFGCTSSDYRYMRPEYLGGSRTPINISSVENMTNTSDNVTPVGSVAGMSVTGDTSSDFSKSFTEHGYLMQISVLRHMPSYQNGIPKMFLKKEMLDTYFPSFANIGEVGITKDELYFNSTEATGKQIFGYQEAWYEYRNVQNSISGELRSNATTPLDMWHLADDYASTPTLSANWIREDKSVLDRALAVTSSTSNQYYADIYFDVNCARVMPMYSIPGLIDHH